jgi:hypothetical protein
MRLIVLGPETQAQIDKVKAHAEAHRFTQEDLLAIMATPDKVAGFNQGFVVIIPYGVRVVYTIEQHPGGWCYHLSFSVDNPDPKSAIQPVAVDQILPMFGINKSYRQADNAWMEEGNIINLLFKI